MDDDFDRNIVTFYFNFMTYLGFWVIVTDSRWKKLSYWTYSKTVNAWTLFVIYMGVLDLIDAVPELNKIFYNVCINLFIFGTWLKTILIVDQSKRINGLRRSLHRNFNTCKDEVEVLIYNASEKDITFITRLFFLALVILYPIWLSLGLFSDYWGDRQFPLPAKWPFSLDINDLKSFLFICLFHGCFALFFLLHALSMDVSMFGLLSQIYREYRFLIKRIEEFGDFCNSSYGDGGKDIRKKAKLGEINIFLQKAKTRQQLKEIIIRQTELFIFIQEFQYGYNSSMFIQIFIGGLLVTVNGIQAMIVSFHFDVKMSYQFGYVFVMLSNILYLCWMTNRISIKSFEVGTAFYTTPWYKMDIDIQKDICFVILRSQSPPRITSGNLLEINLQTFMVFMKNIYSWLALFRQVALK